MRINQSFFNNLWLWVSAIGLSPLIYADPTQSDPEGSLSGQEIAHNVYQVTRGRLMRNVLSQRNKDEVALIINRLPMKKGKLGRNIRVSSFETYVNNKPKNPAVSSLQMAVITSGHARGTGILMTNYHDPKRHSNMLMWLPSLRKFRRISEPASDDYWFGTTLTYGELLIRKPGDETHVLLGESVFEDCLAVMEFDSEERNRYTKKLPEAQCDFQGKPVYQLKSTTKYENWWYDYHISEIDMHSYSLYRTTYYKDSKKIKTVYMDWQTLEQGDPQTLYPRYIYSVLHGNGRDSMVYVPRSTIQYNVDLPDRFWSELTLKKKSR